VCMVLQRCTASTFPLQRNGMLCAVLLLCISMLYNIYCNILLAL
jgi:hypothetical protein